MGASENSRIFFHATYTAWNDHTSSRAPTNQPTPLIGKSAYFLNSSKCPVGWKKWFDETSLFTSLPIDSILATHAIF